LPNCVVSTNTTNVFKSRLDKFCQNQDRYKELEVELEYSNKLESVIA